MIYPACKGECLQGDRRCPHPHECQDDGLGVFRGMLSAFVITLACAVMVALIGWTLL